MNYKISIIVPVYNQEKYIQKCINSLIKQTYRNIEIIIVNDGSTDNSLEICNKLAKSDSRIKIINKENSGVSDSRNIGIEQSTGDYIGFVDSDDYVSNDMFENMLKSIVDYKCDISICDYEVVYEDKYTEKNIFDGKISEISLEEAITKILDESKYKGYCWNKLFKNDLVKKVKFNVKRKIGEDLEFLINIFDLKPKIVYISKPYYKYLFNQSGVTKSNFEKNISKWDGEIELCECLIEKYNNSIFEIFAKKRYSRTNLTTYVNFLKNKSKNEISNKYRKNALKYYKDLVKYKIDYKFKLKLIAIKYFYPILRLYYHFK